MTSTDTSTARLIDNLLVGEQIVVKTRLVRSTLTVVSVRRRPTTMSRTRINSQINRLCHDIQKNRIPATCVPSWINKIEGLLAKLGEENRMPEILSMLGQE